MRAPATETERNAVQRAIVEYLSGGGSVPPGQIFDEFSGRYGEVTVKVEFANLIAGGAIREHPNFPGHYTLAED